MSNEPIVVEKKINASPQKIWAALTDKNLMKQWYFDIVDFTPEVGSEFSFFGKDHDCVEWVHLCRITEVIPNKKLSHTWRYEGQPGDSEVTWNLLDEGEGTRVKLTHAGLETFPPIPALAKDNFVQGWKEIVGSMLPKFLKVRRNIPT